MSAALSDEPTVERQAWRGGILRWRSAVLLVLLVLLVVGTFGLFNLPIEGAAAPRGGATLTRRYDPVADVTVFILDVGKTSGGALFLATCPRVRVLRADGPGGATVIDAPSVTTVSFPRQAAGTYQVVVAGDTPGLEVGQSPGGCGDDAVTIDPAAVPRGGSQLGPSTRIIKLP
jgi:hypothetical protein